ncbi:hypothetical protein C8R43DRAFT_1155381 [Mycena crocata]|nr:hypothetical protein C8R43DRAFT_1155381 [Mycena crocata]
MAQRSASGMSPSSARAGAQVPTPLDVKSLQRDDRSSSHRSPPAASPPKRAPPTTRNSFTALIRLSTGTQRARFDVNATRPSSGFDSRANGVPAGPAFLCLSRRCAEGFGRNERERRALVGERACVRAPLDWGGGWWRTPSGRNPQCTGARRVGSWAHALRGSGQRRQWIGGGPSSRTRGGCVSVSQGYDEKEVPHRKKPTQLIPVQNTRLPPSSTTAAYRCISTLAFAYVPAVCADTVGEHFVLIPRDSIRLEPCHVVHKVHAVASRTESPRSSSAITTQRERMTTAAHVVSLEGDARQRTGSTYLPQFRADSLKTTLRLDPHTHRIVPASNPRSQGLQISIVRAQDSRRSRFAVPTSYRFSLKTYDLDFLSQVRREFPHRIFGGTRRIGPATISRLGVRYGDAASKIPTDALLQNSAIPVFAMLETRLQASCQTLADTACVTACVTQAVSCTCGDAVPYPYQHICSQNYTHWHHGFPSQSERTRLTDSTFRDPRKSARSCDPTRLLRPGARADYANWNATSPFPSRSRSREERSSDLQIFIIRLTCCNCGTAVGGRPPNERTPLRSTGINGPTPLLTRCIGRADPDAEAAKLEEGLGASAPRRFLGWDPAARESLCEFRNSGGSYVRNALGDVEGVCEISVKYSPNDSITCPTQRARDGSRCGLGERGVVPPNRACTDAEDASVSRVRAATRTSGVGVRSVRPGSAPRRPCAPIWDLSLIAPLLRRVVGAAAVPRRVRTLEASLVLEKPEVRFDNLAEIPPGTAPGGSTGAGPLFRIRISMSMPSFRSLRSRVTTNCEIFRFITKIRKIDLRPRVVSQLHIMVRDDLPNKFSDYLARSGRNDSNPKCTRQNLIPSQSSQARTPTLCKRVGARSSFSQVGTTLARLSGGKSPRCCIRASATWRIGGGWGWIESRCWSWVVVVFLCGRRQDCGDESGFMVTGGFFDLFVWGGRDGERGALWARSARERWTRIFVRAWSSWVRSTRRGVEWEKRRMGREWRRGVAVRVRRAWMQPARGGGEVDDVRQTRFRHERRDGRNRLARYSVALVAGDMELGRCLPLAIARRSMQFHVPPCRIDPTHRPLGSTETVQSLGEVSVTEWQATVRGLKHTGTVWSLRDGIEGTVRWTLRPAQYFLSTSFPMDDPMQTRIQNVWGVILAELPEARLLPKGMPAALADSCKFLRGVYQHQMFQYVNLKSAAKAVSFFRTLSLRQDLLPHVQLIYCSFVLPNDNALLQECFRSQVCLMPNLHQLSLTYSARDEEALYQIVEFLGPLPERMHTLHLRPLPSHGAYQPGMAEAFAPNPPWKCNTWPLHLARIPSPISSFVLSTPSYVFWPPTDPILASVFRSWTAQLRAQERHGSSSCSSLQKITINSGYGDSGRRLLTYVENQIEINSQSLRRNRSLQRGHIVVHHPERDVADHLAVMQKIEEGTSATRVEFRKDKRWMVPDGRPAENLYVCMFRLQGEEWKEPYLLRTPPNPEEVD